MTDHPRIFIHVGTHKTGSTFIQNFLHINRDLLLRNGYFYLTSPDDFASHSLPMLLKIGAAQITSEKRERFLKVVKKSLSFENAKNVVVSSEVFCEDLRPEKVKSIKNFISEHASNYADVKIIIYVRRQDLYIESAFSEGVIHGLISKDINHFPSHNLDYYYILHVFAEVFGKKNIIVRPFEKIQFQNGNLTSDFLSVLEISEKDKFTEPASVHRNVKPHPDFIEIARAYNSSGFEKDKAFSTKNVFSHYFGESNMNKADQNVSFLSNEKRHEILHNYEDSNKKVAEKFLGRKQLFFEKITEVNNPKTYDGLSAQAVAAIFTHMHIENLKQIAELKMELRNQQERIDEVEKILTSTKAGEQNIPSKPQVFQLKSFISRLLRL